MKLTFCGAARSVTGSCYHLDLGDTQLLVDCGLFQEWALKGRNWDEFPFDAAAVDAVVLTHAHIDHSGRLPLLVKRGFGGTIHTTHATVDLTEMMLMDSAHIQEEDARQKTKRHRREKRDKPETRPLYTQEDAAQVAGLLHGVDYHKPVDIAAGVRATWNDAGHMLGSGHVELTIERGGKTTTLVFSGDIGVTDRVILRDPEPFRNADIIVCESTYGDELHADRENVGELLTEVILDTIKRGGNVVIPSFAVGRTQTLLYHLRRLMESKAIPPVPTFVDSPMAVRATRILREHPECYDAEARALVEAGKDPVGFEPLYLSESTTSSKAINRIKGTAIIISASGMCTAGRIKHHLVHNLGRRDSTILFVGYQAAHTLGRQILEGQNPVRIFGEMHKVRARIAEIKGLSGHADRQGMIDWLKAFGKDPRQVFITHGDEEVAQSFAGRVGQELGWPAYAPEYQETVEI